ncbi:MAG: hypothetical protein OXF27_08260 [Acidobacteria bacterium]|nr:hypothetical protein [Acidobacteriota bacterium]
MDRVTFTQDIMRAGSFGEAGEAGGRSARLVAAVEGGTAMRVYDGWLVTVAGRGFIEREPAGTFTSDHDAPFADVMFEGEEGAALRIAGMGPARLYDWFQRFRHYRHPNTYGHCGCERAFSVAYDAFTGRSPDALSRAVLDRWAGKETWSQRVEREAVEKLDAMPPLRACAANASYPYCEGCGALTAWPSGDCFTCGRGAPD